MAFQFLVGCHLCPRGAALILPQVSKTLRSRTMPAVELTDAAPASPDGQGWPAPIHGHIEVPVGRERSS